MNRLIFTLFVLLRVVSSWSQKFTPPESYFSGDRWVQHYDKTNGLPEGIVIDIAQDKQGILWLTTPYHLVRFDGLEFKSYKPAQQFKSKYFHFYPGLEIDSKGIVWAVASGAGILSFEPTAEKFTIHHSFETGTDNKSTVLHVAKDESIWTTSISGLVQIKSIGKKFSMNEYPSNHKISWDEINSFLNQNLPLATINKAGDLASIIKDFTIEKPTTVTIFCLGEQLGFYSDYGEIVNSAGKTIWSMRKARTFYAGGASKNKLSVDTLTLSPGKYQLKYISDENHSYAYWNDDKPLFPEWWGISVFNVIDQGMLQAVTQMQPIIQNIIDVNTGGLFGVGTDAVYSIEKKENNSLKFNRFSLPFNFITSGTVNGAIQYKDNLHLILSGFQSPELKSSVVEFNVLNQQTRIIDIRIPIEGSIDNFIIQKDGTTWASNFGEGKGLFIADWDSLLFRPFILNLKNGTNFNEQIWTLFEDKDENIWVGSRQTGLYRISHKTYTMKNYEIKAPVANGIFSDIKENADGTFFLGHSRGILKWDPVTNLSIPFQYMDTIYGAPHFMDYNGKIIYNEGSKIFSWNAELQKFELYKNIMIDSLRLYDIDPTGRVWYFNDKSNTIYYKNAKGLLYPATLDSLSDFWRFRKFTSKGDFLVMSNFNGVNQYKIEIGKEFNENNNQFRLIGNFLPKNTDVYFLMEDLNNTFWAGTYDDGLMKLDLNTGQYKQISKKDGLPSNFIFYISPFKEKLWIVTDVASTMLDTRDTSFRNLFKLDHYFKSLNKTFRNFNEYGYRTSTVKLKNGKYATSIRNGIAFFDLEEFNADTTKPALIIKEFSVNNLKQSIYTEKGSLPTKLNYKQNDIKIEYIGASYESPEDNKYAYYLKGLTKTWIYTGESRTVTFSNLSPGTYEFYLKAANADGIWSDEQKMLTFTISSPWYATIWFYSILLIAILTGIWWYIRYRSKALLNENLVLEAKVNERTLDLQKAMSNLKATQTQLIQSEKMASLGELTAGIAHEIQNPLNFVNNFSSINRELVDEVSKELSDLNKNEVNQLIQDIKNNSDKIHYHGQRASSIVQNMLEHSRTSSGNKELSDINQLCEEYLRLSYHGLRAKDKTFNSDYKSELAIDLPQIMINKQEIARVLLNIINNAFQAVHEKSKKITDGTYNPLVTVKTERQNDKVKITISDNGMGIPDSIKGKIFMPFFTTKPTGQGTGLGLSLSYDIITNGHGGKLEVNSIEGVKTEIVLILSFKLD